jgi:ascorbate PTS system EIIC component
MDCFLSVPQYQNITGAVIVGVLVGLYWMVSSNLTVGPTQRLTENAGFAIGHQQMFAVWLTDKIAGKLGDPKKIWRISDCPNGCRYSTTIL